MNTSFHPARHGSIRLILLLAFAWVALFGAYPEVLAQTTASSSSLFQQPDSAAEGGGLISGIVEVMRWVFSILYFVAVGYLIKAARSYGEENYDKMWSQIGATLFFALIPTITHLVWYIGGMANNNNGSFSLFGS